MTPRHAELVLSGLAGAAILFLFLLMMGLVSCEGMQVGQQDIKLSTVGDAGCQQGLPPYQIPEPATPESGLAKLSHAERTTPVAMVNGVVIPLAELQDRLDKQSPYIRAKYSSPEKRKEILDQLIDLEVLAQAAAREGFASHPDVLRQTKQAMIQKFIDGTFSKQFTIDSITNEEIEAYYNEHKDEYNKPEQIRVGHILVPDKETAEKVLAAAQAKKDDAKEWKSLVATHSQDEETKIKGGDLGYFSEDDTRFEASLVQAAFTLQNNGDMTLAQTTKGWHVLRLTGRRKALKRELKDVSTQIRQKLFSDKRKLEFDRFKGEIRRQSQIEAYYQVLDKLQLNVGAAPEGAAAPGIPAGIPGVPGARPGGRPTNLQEAIQKAAEEARAKALEEATNSSEGTPAHEGEGE